MLFYPRAPSRPDVAIKDHLWIQIVVRGQLHAAHLIAVDHEMVGSDEGLEDHDPAGISGPLKQGVCQLWDVHIHLIGALDQV